VTGNQPGIISSEGSSAPPFRPSDGGTLRWS